MDRRIIMLCTTFGEWAKNVIICFTMNKNHNNNDNINNSCCHANHVDSIRTVAVFISKFQFDARLLNECVYASN